MIELLLFGGCTLAGYALAVWTWPMVRTRMLGLETEIAQLKSRASDLEAELKALGRRIGG